MGSIQRPGGAACLKAFKARKERQALGSLLDRAEQRAGRRERKLTYKHTAREVGLLGSIEAREEGGSSVSKLGGSRQSDRGDLSSKADREAGKTTEGSSARKHAAKQAKRRRGSQLGKGPRSRQSNRGCKLEAGKAIGGANWKQAKQ